MANTAGSPKEFTAWITKHALTKGIQVKKVALYTGLGCADMIEVMRNPYGEYYHRLEWHRTKEAAITRAEEMRTVKIKSLHKQIAKLEALGFPIPEG